MQRQRRDDHVEARVGERQAVFVGDDGGTARCGGKRQRRIEPHRPRREVADPRVVAAEVEPAGEADAELVDALGEIGGNGAFEESVRAEACGGAGAALAAGAAVEGLGGIGHRGPVMPGWRAAAKRPSCGE